LERCKDDCARFVGSPLVSAIQLIHILLGENFPRVDLMHDRTPPSFFIFFLFYGRVIRNGKKNKVKPETFSHWLHSQCDVPNVMVVFLGLGDSSSTHGELSEPNQLYKPGCK
jgi:hypothetical protein